MNWGQGLPVSGLGMGQCFEEETRRRFAAGEIPPKYLKAVNVASADFDPNTGEKSGYAYMYWRVGGRSARKRALITAMGEENLGNIIVSFSGVGSALPYSFTEGAPNEEVGTMTEEEWKDWSPFIRPFPPDWT